MVICTYARPCLSRKNQTKKVDFSEILLSFQSSPFKGNYFINQVEFIYSKLAGPSRLAKLGSVSAYLYQKQQLFDLTGLTSLSAAHGSQVKELLFLIEVAENTLAIR